MKKWEKPQIIVLLRSKPEEIVLQLCKGPGFVNQFAQNVDFGCSQTPLGPCGFCSALSNT